MKMDIIPFERVGNLVFGTKKEVVRKLFGPNFITYPMEPEEKYTKDIYQERDIHLEYNEDDELDHIEVGFKNQTLIFKEVNLFKEKLDDLIQRLSAFDSELEVDELGCISYNLGIALYCDNDEGDIDIVSIYSKNYTEAVKKLRTEINNL